MAHLMFLSEGTAFPINLIEQTGIDMLVNNTHIKKNTELFLNGNSKLVFRQTPS